MAAVFLAISGKLRLTAWDGVTLVANQLEMYSPFSYVVVVLALIIGFLFVLKSTAAPQRRSR